MDASTLLYEAWQKLGRGEEHLEALDRDIQTFLDRKSHSVEREYDSKESKYLFRLKMQPHDPDSRWALMIGDCVHCARSALDYLAWRLAGSDLSDRQTLFPIFLTEDGFENRGLPRLTRVTSRDAVAEIRKLQPFKRNNPERAILWTLQELDARDKHKLLTTTQALTKQFSISFDGGLAFYIPTEATDTFGIKHDAVFAVAIGAPNQDVQVKTDFAFDVAFQEGVLPAKGIYLVRTILREIAKEVEGVLGYFQHLIETNPHWIR